MAEEDQSNGRSDGGESDVDEPSPIIREKGDDQEDDTEGARASDGLSKYDSEREPGGAVRVATAKDQVAEAPDPEAEEGDDQVAGAPVDVTVRGEGTTRAEETDADGEGAEAPEPAAARAETEGVESEVAAEPEGGGGSADAVGGPAEGSEGVDSQREPETPQMPDPDAVLESSGESADGATTEDFEQLLEGEQAVPEQQTYATGDRVEGEVVSTTDYYVFVELDQQTDGVAERREFEEEEGELPFDVGETVEFYVVDVSEDSVALGRQMKGSEGSIDAIREAQHKGVPVEGRVTGTNKGGFEVEVHGVDAFCPISEIDLGYTEEKDVHVDQKYRFKVDEVRDGGDSVVLSRADLLREERAEKRRQTLSELEEGDEVEGVVTRTTGFGAFVDLGGVEGLVHESELSHRHFSHPDDVVEEGEVVDVQVLEIEEEGEDGDPRIGLSRKSTESDPWEAVNEHFAVGEEIEGTVVRNAPFGAFVEIAPGVEGLVHVSEMSWTEHVRTPDEMVEPGDVIQVEIQDIDLSGRRIGLSMKAVEGDPWDEVTDHYAPGMEVEGEVENIEEFGVFVSLPTGITALMPRSQMELPSGVTPRRRFSEGEVITAEILNVDPDEREMALTRPDDSEGPSEAADDATDEGAAQTDHRDDDEESFGTLGDQIAGDLDLAD